jgi:hypothetical protein
MDLQLEIGVQDADACHAVAIVPARGVWGVFLFDSLDALVLGNQSAMI